MSSSLIIWQVPPAPQNDDVICEQPLNILVLVLLHMVHSVKRFAPYRKSIWEWPEQSAVFFR